MQNVLFVWLAALGERTAIAGEREAWHRARESVAAELRLSQKKATMAEEEQVRLVTAQALSPTEAYARRRIGVVPTV